MTLIASIIEEYGMIRAIAGLAFVAAVFIGIIISWYSEGTVTYKRPVIFQKPLAEYPKGMDLTYAFSYVKAPILTQRELKQYYILKAHMLLMYYQLQAH